jgi:hypothetical protein
MACARPKQTATNLRYIIARVVITDYCIHMKVTYLPLMSPAADTVKPVVVRPASDKTTPPVFNPVITQVGVDAYGTLKL